MASSFLYTYDIALRSLVYNRFGSILGIGELGPNPIDAINQGVVLCPKGIVLRYLAEKRTQLFLEFINIYRSSVSFSWARQRTVVSRRGYHALRPDGTTETIKADAVDLNYNMWFWSNSLDKVNLCAEKYLQWIQEVPKIVLTYNDVYNLNPDLIFEGPVVDESRIEELYRAGKVWTFRMPLKIEAWLPKSGGLVEKIEKIRVTFYEKDEVANYVDIVVEDSNQDTSLAEALRMFRANLYRIIGVDKINKTFVVACDRTADFEESAKIIVENTTKNNGMYTIVSAMYSESEVVTFVKVVESIPDETVEGNLYLQKNWT